jgi:hypothetical protein
MRRSHGQDLQERCDGEGVPPTHNMPLHKGSAKLERTHPFHYKMNPAIILGPRCKHDVGVLPKLSTAGQLLAYQRADAAKATDVAVHEQNGACPVAVSFSVHISSANSATCDSASGTETLQFQMSGGDSIVGDERGDVVGKTLLDRAYQQVGSSEHIVLQMSTHLYTSMVVGGDDDWLSSLDELIEGIVAAEHYCVDYSSKECMISFVFRNKKCCSTNRSAMLSSLGRGQRN